MPKQDMDISNKEIYKQIYFKNIATKIWMKYLQN